MAGRVHGFAMWAAVALVLLLGASTVRAQTAEVLDIDPSAISAGMAGASGAAFWTAEPNYWANPALLGYSQGVRWQWGRTTLLPGFADLPFKTVRYTLGAYGIGFENAGRPVGGMGRTFVDYGLFDFSDPNGYYVGTFDAYEEVKSWGVGVSVARLVSSIMVLQGREAPAIFDHVDLAAGMTSKSTTVALGPQQASARPTDHGVLLRGGVESKVPRGMGALPLRSDLALGASLLNDNDASFRFATPPPKLPSQNRIWSAAIHEALGMPQSLRDRGRSPVAAFLLDGLDPMVSFGLAYDHVTAKHSSDWSINRVGAELTAIRVLSLRAGYWSDPGNKEVHWGFGIALPAGDVAEVRFDYAQYPQALLGLGPVSPRSFSVVVDPIALSRRLRGGAGTD